MFDKLYGMMNWPLIEGIEYTDIDNPSDLLGQHVIEDGLLIQSFVPDADKVSVKYAGKLYEMYKMDDDGFYATILDSDNLESLHDKLSDAGTKLLLDTLPGIIEGTNNREEQDPDQVTYAYNIKREEEHIDFTKTCREVFNLIRGLSPIPCSNVLIDDKEMKIYDSKITEKKYNGTCGEIVDITKEGIVVLCSDGAIVIKEVKPFGKKRMDAYSYANGVGKNNLIGKVLS